MTSQVDRTEPPPSSPSQEDIVAIAVPGSAGVVGPPRVTFESAVADFAVDVLSEASFREASARGSTSKDVQYTSAYFEQAKFEVRNAGYSAKTPWWLPWARVISPVSFTMLGVAIPLAFAEESWPGWGIIAGAALVLGGALSITAEFTKKGNR